MNKSFKYLTLLLNTILKNGKYISNDASRFHYQYNL